MERSGNWRAMATECRVFWGDDENVPELDNVDSYRTLNIQKSPVNYIFKGVDFRVWQLS